MMTVSHSHVEFTLHKFCVSHVKQSMFSQIPWSEKEIEEFDFMIGKALENHTWHEVREMFVKKVGEGRARNVRFSEIHFAAYLNRCDVLNVLIQRGTDVNAVQKDIVMVRMLYNHTCKGETALHFAARSGHAEAANMLLRNGAKCNITNSIKKTALAYAVEEGHVEIVKILIQNGADVNGDTNVGNWSLLHSAAGCGHVSVVKMLIQSGSSVNACGRTNGTALAQAAKHGCVEIVKILIENGADVNLAGETFGLRPLHLAASNGKFDTAKVLIENGADVNVVTNLQNQTPLHMASGDVTKVLLLNGGDVNALCDEKKTPLFLAAKEARVLCTLHLICFGAKIDRKIMRYDNTGLITAINDKLNYVRKGCRMYLRGKIKENMPLMSDEEKRFMWNLAFVLARKHIGIAFKLYYTIRSFITFKGIFMIGGYDLGVESIWRGVIDDSDDDDDGWGYHI